MSQLIADDTGTRIPTARRAPLWRQRNFALLWTGQTISLTGSAVTTIALPLAAITMLRASVIQVGLLTAATYGAFIVVSLPAGLIVDRLPKRRIMVCCDAARLSLIGSVPVAAALHRLTLGQLYAIALATGTCAVFFDVSQQSYLPSVLGPEDLTEGFGKLGASASFAQVSGRGLASGLVAVIGAARAVTADALSYAVSVTCLLLLRTPEPRPARSPGTGPLRRDVTQGLTFITGHPVLRKTTACAAAGNLFIAMQISLNLLFLIRVLHVPPAIAGLYTALGSLGGIAGGMLTASISRRIGSARIIWLSLLVFDIPSLLLPLAGPGWKIVLFVLGYGVSAFSCAVFGASQLAYRQSVCPPDLRGRMNAATRWITWGILPAGGMLGGFAGSAIGIRPAIWIAYAGSWAAGLLVYFSPLRRARDVADLGPASGSPPRAGCENAAVREVPHRRASRAGQSCGMPSGLTPSPSSSPLSSSSSSSLSSSSSSSSSSGSLSLASSRKSSSSSSLPASSSATAAIPMVVLSVSWSPGPEGCMRGKRAASYRSVHDR